MPVSRAASAGVREVVLGGRADAGQVVAGGQPGGHVIEDPQPAERVDISASPSRTMPAPGCHAASFAIEYG